MMKEYHDGKDYLTITEKDVEFTFKNLMIGFGSTTSLEVKDTLRRNDFWVDQAFVSKAIAECVAKNPDMYSVTYENGHKVYELDWSKSTPLTSVNPLGTSTPNAKLKVKKTAKKGTYTVWADCLKSLMTGDVPVEVYSDITRNAARYAYAKKYAVEYTEVTANKV